MRYGTRTIAGKKWMQQGYRPLTVQKYGCKYFYLFQACQPSTGKMFELLLPNMSGACFKAFMKEFAAEHPGQIMIMDNAGCYHVNWDKTEIQPDVEIIYWPPYSPDLNPQERLFQEMKKPLKGKLFLQLEEIEQEIIANLQQLKKHPNLVKKLTNWIITSCNLLIGIGIIVSNTLFNKAIIQYMEKAI